MRYCQNCQTPQENLRSETCESCGGQLSGEEKSFSLRSPEPSVAPQFEQRSDGLKVSPPGDPEHRYPAVRTLSAICRGLAFLSILVGVIVAAAGIFSSTGAGIAFSLFALLYSLGSFILLMALAEGMKIAVDIEANTRASLEYLRSDARGHMN